MTDNSTKAQCKQCFHFLASRSNSTLRNHIMHPRCKALKTVPKEGQSSMAQDGSVFVYNLDAVREQFTGLVIQEGLPFNHFDNTRMTRVFQTISNQSTIILVTIQTVTMVDKKANELFIQSFQGLYNTYYLKYGDTTTQSTSGTSSSKTHSDFEEEILEEEVQDNEAIALSDEEIALDEAASDASNNFYHKMSAIDDLKAIDDDNDNSLPLDKVMELDSAENGFPEINDILKENEPCGLDELMTNCIMNKEENSGEYAFATNNGFCGEDEHNALPNDFPFYEFCASPQQMFSPLQTGFGDNVVLSNDQLVNDDDERLCGDHISRSSLQVEVKSIHNNVDAEVSGQVLESSLKEDVIEEPEMVHESFISMSSYDSTKPRLTNGDEEDENVTDVLTELVSFSVEVNEFMRNNDPVRSDQHSPDTSQLAPKSSDQASPEITAKPQHVHEQPYTSEVNKTPSDEKNHESLNTSQQEESLTHSASAKSHSQSPRYYHSHRNHRKSKRSKSRSPSGRNEPSSRHMRDHRERSRSRSPRRREYHRRSRSPRRRYLPSHISSPSSYRSRYRSPKRGHWSPPQNRNTGLGKPGRNLFIAGFSFLTTERDLERKFSRFGRARDVRIVRNKRSGESRGFGFLTLERDEDADAAIRALDKTEWNGRVILVEKSKPQ
uniref:RNA-binding protein rsd1 n=1 Tax=Tanacetum cinerariifolium TaxID=118510 RepID=A0A6L2J759_TANCI|nr:RNA-binding protein rsd1 [Tanacetum cinerariifolium]